MGIDSGGFDECDGHCGSSHSLEEELKDLERRKDDGLLLMGIPGLNFLGLMDMGNKERRIKEIKEKLGREN